MCGVWNAFPAWISSVSFSAYKWAHELIWRFGCCLWLFHFVQRSQPPHSRSAKQAHWSELSCPAAVKKWVSSSTFVSWPLCYDVKHGGKGILFMEEIEVDQIQQLEHKVRKRCWWFSLWSAGWSGDRKEMQSPVCTHLCSGDWGRWMLWKSLKLQFDIKAANLQINHILVLSDFFLWELRSQKYVGEKWWGDGEVSKRM